MLKRSFILLVMGLLCLALTGTSLADRIEEKSFPLTANGSILVKNVAGTIVIYGWDEERVKMIATKTGAKDENLDKIKIAIDAREDYLKIDTQHPIFTIVWRGRVNYELWVPAGATVQAKSTSGLIQIEDQRSDVRAHTVSGDIELTNIQGKIDADTTSGDIYTKKSKGNVIARSVSGDLKILKAQGAVTTIKTVSGDIWVELEEIDYAVLQMDFNSISGDINLFLPLNIAAEIDMNTVSGRLSCDFPITIKAMSAREFRGIIGEGDIGITLKTVSGDIYLRSL